MPVRDPYYSGPAKALNGSPGMSVSERRDLICRDLDCFESEGIWC